MIPTNNSEFDPIAIAHIEWFIKSDNTSKKNGILSAPRQGKKNLAKFLGIDMSALALADDEPGNTHDHGTCQQDIDIIITFIA